MNPTNVLFILAWIVAGSVVGSLGFEATSWQFISLLITHAVISILAYDMGLNSGRDHRVVEFLSLTPTDLDYLKKALEKKKNEIGNM